MPKLVTAVLAFVIAVAVGGYGARRMADGAMMAAGTGAGVTTGIGLTT